MKKIIFLLCIGMAFVGCKKKGCIDPLADNYDVNADIDDGSCTYGSPTSNSFSDYMFSITIDGVTHKIEGSYGSSYITGPTLINHCYWMNTTSGATLSAGIADKSDPSYVSGDIFALQFHVPNPTIGTCDYSILFTNSTNLVFPQSINSSYGLAVNQGLNPYGYLVSNATINITDLGTATVIDYTNTYSYYDFGDPVTGNFSGTLYGSDGTLVLNSSTGQYEFDYNIPVQVEIDFKAARYN